MRRQAVHLAVAGVLAVAVLPAGSGQRPGVRTYLIDASASRVVIHVDKAGLFAFAGHTHEVIAPAVKGDVRYDARDPSRSSVHVEFETAALRVTGKGEPPEDVPEVQRVMLSDRVLDVARYPAIVFESTTVTVAERTREGLALVLDGRLTLHGVTRPVQIRIAAGLGPGGITASGRFSIKQTDYGIRPVTAGAGTVRVKDELQIEFTVVARPGSLAPEG